jgi:hypothetical protein
MLVFGADKVEGRSGQSLNAAVHMMDAGTASNQREFIIVVGVQGGKLGGIVDNARIIAVCVEFLKSNFAHPSHLHSKEDQYNTKKISLQDKIAHGAP